MQRKTTPAQTGIAKLAAPHEHETKGQLPARLVRPVMSRPDDWCTFNDRYVHPWATSRADAAAALRRIRSLSRRGEGTLLIEATGRYRLATFNTVILRTREWPADSATSGAHATASKQGGTP